MKINEIINKVEGKRIKQGMSFSIDKGIANKIRKICKEKEISPSHLVNEILADAFGGEKNEK